MKAHVFILVDPSGYEFSGSEEGSIGGTTVYFGQKDGKEVQTGIAFEASIWTFERAKRYMEKRGMSYLSAQESHGIVH